MCSPRVANGRSAVKRPNKGLHPAGSGASMDSTSSPRPEYESIWSTKLTEQLTERQNKILDYIRYVTRVRSYPPSVREIGEAVGLSSSSTVHNHLNQLERRGPVKRGPPKAHTPPPSAGAPGATQRAPPL